MKIPWYLLLLVLPWASFANAEDSRQAISTTDVRPEIAEILTQPEIGLTDLFRVAELANPDLALARIEVQTRAGRLRQVGLFTNPELSLAIAERSVDNPSFHKQKVELSQTLLIGGRRGAAVRAARAEVDQATEQTLRARRDALRRVHGWWTDQIHLREVDAALADLMTEAERTLAIARTRFEAKAAPESHVTRAMLEVYDLTAVRQEFERKRVLGVGEMKVVFGGLEVPTSHLVGSLEPDPNDAHLHQESVAPVGDHPALRAAQLGVEAAEAMLVTARRERVPDLNLFVAYGRARPDEGNFVEGGISVPLPLFQRNQGRIVETASLVAKARQEERIAAFELEVALSSARLTHRTTSQQLAQLTEQIRPAAERSLTQAQEAYRVGHLMFLELVDAQRTYNDVLLRTMALRRDLALAAADLMSLLGTGLYADNGEK